MVNTIKVKRGTRAGLTTLAGANNLSAGEPYLITDEGRLAIGLTVSTYNAFVKQGETFSGTVTGLVPAYGTASGRVLSDGGWITAPSGGGTVADKSITFAKLQDIDTDTFMGRTDPSTGVPTALTIAQAKEMLALAGAQTGEIATGTLIGNNAGAPLGAPMPLTATQVKALLTYVASDIAYQALETGGTSRTLQAKFGDFLYPKDFGCVCDGTTDDTVNFQKAVNASAAGRKILFMPKTIKLGNVINIPAMTHIMGPGQKCVIVTGAGTYDLFTFTGSDSTIENIHIDSAARTGGFEFDLDCNASSFERIIIRNINTFSSFGAIRDTGTSFIHITTRIRDCQFRLHRGPGVVFSRAYAFLFMNEVVIDYVNSANGNYTGFDFISSGLGAGAGGIFCRDCEVLGTAGTVNHASQNGFNIRFSDAVGLFNCRADTLGGYGYRLDTIDKLVMSDVSAGLNYLYAFSFTAVTNSVCIGVNAFGRKNQAYKTTSDGIRFESGCYGLNFSGGFVRDFDGIGINKVANQPGHIQFSNYYIANNGTGVSTIGTSVFLINTSTFTANTTEYVLAAGFNYLVSCMLNSGTIVNANSTGFSDIITGPTNLKPVTVDILNNGVAYPLTGNMGIAKGAIHMSNGASDMSGNAITFGANGAPADYAEAGIYSVGSGAVGSYLIFATTNNYGGGPQSTMTIDPSGRITAVRAPINVTVAPAAPTNGDLWITSAGVNARVNGATITLGAAGAIPIVDPLSLSASAVPSTPGTGIKVFGATRSGYNIPMWVDPNGRTERAQKYLGSNSIILDAVQVNTTTTSQIGLAWTNLAAPVAAVLATTNYLTMQRRFTYTIAAAGGIVERRANTPVASRRAVGGGFHSSCKMGIVAAPADCRVFFGHSSTNAAQAAVQPSTMLNFIALAKDQADTALSVMHNDGTGTATKIALPNTGTLTGIANSTWQFEVQCHAGSTTFGYRVTRWSDTGVETVDEGVTGTTKLPAIDTLFVPRLWMNAVTAVSTSFAYIQFEMEID